MRGAKGEFRRAFRGLEVGQTISREDLISRLRQLNPNIHDTSIGTYISWAKKGRLPGCPTIRETLSGYEITHEAAPLPKPEPKPLPPPPMPAPVIQGLDGPIPRIFPSVLARARLGCNILLVGPAGAGKTHMAGMVAKAIGRRFAHVSCSAGMSEGVLLGRLLPTGDAGTFEYSPSEFVFFYEEGGVFLLDEMDAADSNVMLVLNAAISNGSLSIPNRLANPTAKRHKDFLLIAAANTFGTGPTRIYAGRNQLDAATLDRFVAMEIDYDATVEESLVDAQTLSWGRKIREKINAQNPPMRRLISTRKLATMSRLRRAGMQMAEEERRAQSLDWDAIRIEYFSGWTTDEKAKVGEAS